MIFGCSSAAIFLDILASACGSVKTCKDNQNSYFYVFGQQAWGIIVAENQQFMKYSFCRVLLFILGLTVLPLAKAQILQDFSERLDEVNGDRPESLALAVGACKEFMADCTPAVADSAYVLLEDFAVMLTRNTDFNLILLQSGNRDRHAREKKAAVDYERLLDRLYFSVIRKNGLIIVRPDLFRIQTELKDYLSPRTYAYFDAVRQDTNAGGGTEILDFSPEEIARRLCYWDEFLSDSTFFLYGEEAVRRRDAYLEQLIFGSGNHPVFAEDGLLSEAYGKAYRLVMECDRGKSASVVGDYMKLLEENGYRDGPAVWMFKY